MEAITLRVLPHISPLFCNPNSYYELGDCPKTMRAYLEKAARKVDCSNSSMSCVALLWQGGPNLGNVNSYGGLLDFDSPLAWGDIGYRLVPLSSPTPMTMASHCHCHCRWEFLWMRELMKLRIFDTKMNRIQSRIYYDPANIYLHPKTLKSIYPK